MKQNFKQLLAQAKKDRVAIAAFNFDNYEKLVAIVEASEELKQPVIAMLTESASKYMDMDAAYGMFKGLTKTSNQTQLLMFDHGMSLDQVKKAIDIGYDVVMLDHSLLSDEQNIAGTIDIVKYAKAKNVFVESEIGHVGGKEDDNNTKAVNESVSVERAAKFFKSTNVDALAIAIGSAHGVYKSVPKLDIKRVGEISKLTNSNLVLHGGSGIPDSEIVGAIKAGINKVNFGTELKIANASSLSSFFSQYPSEFDARKFGRYSINKIKEVVISKMKLIISK